MNILIRCDSSNIIGTGHVMRCLNLCEYHPENIYTFVCRNFNMNITNKIIDAGHKLILLEYDIEPKINEYKTWIGKNINNELNELEEILQKNNYDEIIIDHYGIDYEIENIIKKYCKKLIVISDIFEFEHYCDEFINYNCDDKKKLVKINLNPDTKIKCGVENIILNKKFLNVKKTVFNNKIKKMCVMLGGSDPQNYTLKILEKINELINEYNIKLYIVIGKSNGNIESIKQFIGNNTNYQIVYDLNYDQLIDLYMEIDLCIGSLSITAHERLYIGVPQICLKIVDNQNIQQLNEFNICEINELDDNIKKYIKLD